MKEYKIEVNNSMLKTSEFLTKWNGENPMPLKIMYGVKLKETKGMVMMRLHGDIKERLIKRCMHCGREITNPVSQFFGIGPVCGGHNYTSPFASEAELNEAIAKFRTKLVNTVWTGWIVKKWIESIDDDCDIYTKLAEMPIVQLSTSNPEATSNTSKPKANIPTIWVRVDRPAKGTDDFSAFVSFKYNEQIKDYLKGLELHAWNGDTKEWEINYKDLDALILAFPDYKFDIKGKEKLPTNTGIPKDYAFKTHPMNHQLAGIKYGLEHTRWLLADEMGLGKALALDTKIYTPDGYKLMRDIQVGDYVFGKDGKPTKVVATYNHHNVEMYRITFSDGVTIDCCKDHLWEIHDQHGLKVVPTSWFLQKDQFGKLRKDNLRNNVHVGGYKYWIDRCQPVQFTSQTVPIDPYLLGVLLGDGNITKDIIITSADSAIIDEVNNRLPTEYHLVQTKSMNPIDYRVTLKSPIFRRGVTYYADGELIGDLDSVIAFLRINHRIKTKNRQSIYKYLFPKALDRQNFRYGYHWQYVTNNLRYADNLKNALYDLRLLGTNSHTKFIPDIYKYSAVTVRFDLLRGLLDTDGYVGSGNCVQYTTVSKQLCMDVQYLVESLGGIVSYSTKPCGYNKHITGVSYTLTIKMDHPEDLFLLPRKQQIASARHFIPHRSIVSIDKIDNADAKCIAVDNSDHLYLAEHFVVTHNTKQIVDLGKIRKNVSAVKHCLVVCCVNSLKWNWLEEIEKHSNETGWILGMYQMKRSGKWAVGGTKEKVADLDKLLAGDAELDNHYFIITNVESLRNKEIIDRLVKLCQTGVIGMVACDEAHRCKDTRTQQMQGLLQVQPEYRIAMTGTPLVNSPLDLFALLKWLGYQRYGFKSFRDHFCYLDQYNAISGYKNIDQLEKKLDSIMLRRTKKQVLPDLPDKVYISEYVELTDEQKDLYNQIIDAVIEDPEIEDKLSLDCQLAVKLRLRQVSGGIAPFDFIKKSPKLDRMEELVEEAVYSGNKVVIFSNWQGGLAPAIKRLEKYNPLVITGETEDYDRQVIKNKFQTDDTYKVIFCTIGAAGVGLTLTAASEVIFLDEPFTNAAKEQAIDRTHRIGTKSTVVVHTIMGHNTYDEDVHNIVLGKRDLSDAIVDKNALAKMRIY